MKKVFFPSKNGLRLCGVWHIPEKKTDKAVILAHGITVGKDENGIFLKLADALNAAGIAAFRFDFSGVGESEGASVDTTITRETQDLESAINQAGKKFPKTGLLGASFGGAIAALTVSENQRKLSCLCLWNPALNLDHTFLHPLLPWLRENIDRIQKEINSVGYSSLGSRNFTVGKNLFDEMTRFKPYEALKKISIPTMIIHGDADDHVPYEDSVKYIKNLSDAKLVTLPGANHGFQDPNDAPRAIESTVKFFRSHLP